MKILFIIDHFGSGGAQRQIVNLAIALKKQNYDVHFFIYYPQYTFFRKSVEAAQIPIFEYDKFLGSNIGLLRRLNSLIRGENYCVVVSYLKTPNMYLELVKMFGCSSRIVVSERSSYLAEKVGVRSFIQRILHVWSDVVVVNSESQGSWLSNRFSWLKNKIRLIYNGIEIGNFSSSIRCPERSRDLKLLAVGRVEQNKNLLNLLRALILFYQENNWVPEVKWVGRRDEVTIADKEYCAQVDAILESQPKVKEKWIWMGERSDVPDLLKVSDALIHPSFSEGLPNVICEGLSSSLPVLCSNICDNGLLVNDGKRGFTFDPYSPEDICRALEKLVKLTKDEWLAMSRNSRNYAEATLSMERLVENYEQLFNELISQHKA